MTPPPLDPLPQTKVTTAGKGEIYHWENLVGPFLVHKIFGSQTPLLSSRRVHTGPIAASSLRIHPPGRGGGGASPVWSSMLQLHPRQTVKEGSTGRSPRPPRAQKELAATESHTGLPSSGCASSGYHVVPGGFLTKLHCAVGHGVPGILLILRSSVSSSASARARKWEVMRNGGKWSIGGVPGRSLDAGVKLRRVPRTVLSGPQEP